MIFEYLYQGFGTIVKQGNARGSPSTLFRKNISIELSKNQSNFLEQYEIVPFQYTMLYFPNLLSMYCPNNAEEHAKTDIQKKEGKRNLKQKSK